MMAEVVKKTSKKLVLKIVMFYLVENRCFPPKPKFHQTSKLGFFCQTYMLSYCAF